MNENHDDQGRFSSAGSSAAAKSGLMQKIKDFAGNTSGKGHIDHAGLVPQGVKAALTKERFVHAVPPGSTRDRVVKEAASWAKMGLEKGAAMALGGPIAAGGVMVAQYTKWGGSAAREFGPKIASAVRSATGRK